MSIEGCSLFFDEDYREDNYSNCSNWNGRSIEVKTENKNYLFENYAFQKSKEIENPIKPMKGTVGGSFEAKKKIEEGSYAKGEVHVSAKDDKGGKVSVEAEAKVNKDKDGNVKGEVGVKVVVEKDF